MIHKYTKKKFSIVAILFAVFLLLASSTVVQAAGNPLSKMPKTAGFVLNSHISGKGCDYFTPEYSAKVQINAKSYNPNIVTVDGYTFKNRTNGKYYAGYETTAVSPGTTKIKITVTVGAKSYTKLCTYTVCSWKNPLKSLKIGSKNYFSKFNQNGSAVLNENISGKKFTFRLDSDFTPISISCYARKNGSSASTIVKRLKSGQTLPKNAYYIWMHVKSKTNHQFYDIGIFVPQN